MNQLIPPVPPRAPAPSSENASSSERADYQARRARYHAKLRVYEHEVDKYQRAAREALGQFVSDPDASQPLRSEPIPEAPHVINHSPDDALTAAPLSTEISQAEPPPAVLFDYDGHTYVKPYDMSELNLALNLAGAAVAMHVEAGDLFWHGGVERFAWPDEEGTLVEMDAETFIDFAKAAYNAR